MDEMTNTTIPVSAKITITGDLGSGNAGRFAVGAPFVRVSVRSDLMNNTGTCKFVLLGVK